VDLQDLEARGLVGVRELDLAVDAPRAEERRVENVDPVCGHQDLVDGWVGGRGGRWFGC
jgi:hypothetical protein